MPMLTPIIKPHYLEKTETAKNHDNCNTVNYYKDIRNPLTPGLFFFYISIYLFMYTKKFIDGNL